MKARIILTALVAISLGLLFSCKDEKDSNPNSSQANFYLTDAPGDYDAVFIDVAEVRVITPSGQYSSSAQAGIYNLLELTGGKDTLLASIQVPSESIQEIRLVLGSNNTVVVDSVSYALKTPSAQSSGLKIKFEQNLEADMTYNWVLDFDAGQSVVERGNGDYLLKPVIRVYNRTQSGAQVDGSVVPDSVQSHVLMISAFNDSISTYTDDEGNFKFNNVTTGVYRIEAKAGNLVGVKTGIQISSNTNISVGTITME